MALTSKDVEVRRIVRVIFDEAKFTPAFFDQFNATISDFGDDLDLHRIYLGRLFAAGVIDNGQFIEGYGPSAEMGIKLVEIEEDVDIRPELEAL